MERLSAAEIARVRDQHSLGEVLHRAGVIDQPVVGNRDVMISCPRPGHEDRTPSCVIHPASQRFYCFGCGAHGDVFSLVRELTGLTSLADIAVLLDSGQPITAAGGVTVSRPVRVLAAAPVGGPDPDRTPLDRILNCNREAWAYLSYSRLADRSRLYLTRRGVDLWPLEARTGAPLVGHTPTDRSGLTAHLRRRGYSTDELVDAGWTLRTPDGLIDRFRDRVLFPVTDEHAQLCGVIGRDVTGRARQRYLNTAHTAAYRKGELLYQPVPASGDATVVVCEGPVDALAICAASSDLLAVAPSGTALTALQALRVRALTSRPPLLCADGDTAGTAAAHAWAQTFTHAGRETRIVTLPDGHDPASWLQQHGPDALATLLPGAAAARDRSITV